MYHKILVALENSASDEAILTHVRELARTHQAELILVHVAEGFGARYQETLNLEDSQEIQDDRAYLERVRSDMAAAGVNARAVLETGEPAVKLVEAAEREACDLIAMATHRHRAIGDLVLGSVASAVRHRTMIPVLMVPSR